MEFTTIVIPAQAGIHFSTTVAPRWIPACAGMTMESTRS